MAISLPFQPVPLPNSSPPLIAAFVPAALFLVERLLKRLTGFARSDLFFAKVDTVEGSVLPGIVDVRWDAFLESGISFGVKGRCVSTAGFGSS